MRRGNSSLSLLSIAVVVVVSPFPSLAVFTADEVPAIFRTQSGGAWRPRASRRRERHEKQGRQLGHPDNVEVLLRL